MGGGLVFHRERVIAALEAKADRFAGYDAQLHDALAAYEQALIELQGLSRQDIEVRLADLPWPGARPTEEHTQHPDLIVPFAPGTTWENHAQARAWAMKALDGVPTIAVDGSQITPSKDFSVPVGAVQVGWFINPHAAEMPYVKDIAFEVLAPDELADEDEDIVGFPDWRVNLQRFLGECERLKISMADYRDAAAKPVCFFDGSLIVSFVQHMLPQRQRLYIGAILSLLDASEAYRVPLVGYVDTSYANDLAAMLDALTGRRSTQRISDGALLRDRLAWGDRSTTWICARDDGVEPVDGSKYYERVCFTYLKTTADRSPARLDLPCWLLEAGELEHTLDVVRAECVVGNGYPYALETADAVAVITMQDRERFYRVFQEFAEKEGLPLRFSRKAVSKRSRRI
ncbi:MAG: DNA double-strand break repair nuclease NurA [Anaerolineae bacterium]|nr:DNA double-strand break repair nuclease NurA [Anaerolineae bacterium]